VGGSRLVSAQFAIPVFRLSVLAFPVYCNTILALPLLLSMFTNAAASALLAVTLAPLVNAYS
jgi:hypothetical protein